MTALSAPALDAATLLFSISMFGFLMAGISLSSASAMPSHRPALVEWSKAMTAAGVAFLFYFLRGHAPWLVTFFFANLLVMATAVYGHFAFLNLLQMEARRTPALAVSMFGLSGVVASYVWDTPRQVAVFTISVGVAVMLGMTAVLLGRSAQSRRTPSALIAAAVTVLLSATFAMRATISAFGDASSVSPASSSAAQLSSLLSGAAFIVAASIGFFTLVHERQRQAIMESARRDGLTGLHTRTAFFDLAAECEEQIQSQPYAIVMIDIDHFKRINDTFGHGGGDVTLAHAARLIAGAVRISDVVGRYGGEEFCILLRDCNERQAADLARRLVLEASRQSVRLPDDRTVSYTLSVGYAVAQPMSQANPSTEALNEVIERADRALYVAKRQGRNQALAALPRARPAEALKVASAATGRFKT